MLAAPRFRLLPALAWIAAAAATPPALAQEAANPLRLRVGPSGYEQDGRSAGRETLEQKIARRERDFLFRSICRGCLPAEAEARVFGPSRMPDSLVEPRTAPAWPE